MARGVPGSAARPCRISGRPAGGAAARCWAGPGAGTRAVVKGAGAGSRAVRAWGDVPAEWCGECTETAVYWRSERVFLQALAGYVTVCRF